MACRLLQAISTPYRLETTWLIVIKRETYNCHLWTTHHTKQYFDPTKSLTRWNCHCEVFSLSYFILPGIPRGWSKYMFNKSKMAVGRHRPIGKKTKNRDIASNGLTVMSYMLRQLLLTQSNAFQWGNNQNCPGGIRAPPNTLFLGLIRVHDANGRPISVGSANRHRQTDHATSVARGRILALCECYAD